MASGYLCGYLHGDKEDEVKYGEERHLRIINISQDIPVGLEKHQCQTQITDDSLYLVKFGKIGRPECPEIQLMLWFPFAS